MRKYQKYKRTDIKTNTMKKNNREFYMGIHSGKGAVLQTGRSQVRDPMR
jgi:hypothetical protein